MTFIILLVLIVLVGLAVFLVSRNSNHNFDKLKRDVHGSIDKANGISARVDSNEKNIGAIGDELQKISAALNRCATADELNGISLRLNELQATVSEISSDKKISQGTLSKIDGFNETISELQVQINSDASKFQDELKNLRGNLDRQKEDFDGRIRDLENRPQPESSTPSQVPPDNSSKIVEERFAALDTKISEHNQTLLQHKNSFGQVQYYFNALQKKIGDQQTLIDEQQKLIDNQRQLFDSQQNLLTSHAERIKILESKVSTPPPAPPSPPNIRDFHIKKSNAPLFTNNPSDLSKALAAIKNLSGITTFLENSHFEKKGGFLRQTDIYRKNIDRFIDKVQRGKFDEENFSDEATEAFMDVLSKYFLSVIPVAIYRGRKDDPKFYADFLAKVNEYLRSCRVYTKLVEPKKIMTTNQLEFMTIVRNDTKLRSEDKIIDEVERLPYFVDYITEDSATETACSEGKMVVLKFSEDKK